VDSQVSFLKDWFHGGHGNCKRATQEHQGGTKMGTNLFVEGFPAPFLIEVRLTRSVSDFAALTEVASALAEIDRYLAKAWYKEWPRFSGRRRRDTRLVSFRLTTPPEFKILADPAWLAVLVMILVGYKDLKASLRELGGDVGGVVKRIKGLSERQAQLLEIAVKLTLERHASRAEAQGGGVAARLHRTRSRLVGGGVDEPSAQGPYRDLIEIIVTDIDKYRGW
jgi:hypothetical protein